MATTTESLNATLTELGWKLNAVCVNPGGYGKESIHSVTLKRNGQSFTTEYRMGCAHRRWVARNKTTWNHRNGVWGKYYQPGERIQQFTQQKFCADSTPATDFDAMTEPIPPVLADVLHCLVSDANCVRYGQTFDEFCAELGYDNDSRTAERVFNACRDTWAAIIRLGGDLDQLTELFQDY